MWNEQRTKKEKLDQFLGTDSTAALASIHRYVETVTRPLHHETKEGPTRPKGNLSW